MMELEKFISQDENKLYEILEDTLTISSYPDFNWLGFAEYGERKAIDLIREGQNARARKWLLMTSIVYEYLMGADPQNSSDFSYMLNWLKIKVIAINSLEVSSEDTLCDIDVFIESVLAFLNGYKFSDIVRKVDKWKELGKAEILELRRIKNVINILGSVDSSILKKEYGGINKWLSIRDKLP